MDPDRAARISQYPQIIAFRNILIHGYDLVDPALAWSTLQTQLPVTHIPADSEEAARRPLCFLGE